MTGYWVVHMRKGEDNENEYDFVTASRGLICIYWDAIGDQYDLLKMDNDDLNGEIRRRLEDSYPDESVGTITNWMTSIKNFVYEIEVGDFVISPTVDNRIYLGLITSGYFFDGTFHYRKVEWRLLARDLISEGLHRSIGVERTVYSVTKHREEIAQLYLNYGL